MQCLRFCLHGAEESALAAFVTIAAFRGRTVSPSGFRKAIRTSCGRKDIPAIVAAAESVGLTPCAMRATPEALATATLPAIAHWLEPHGNHFVVLYKISSGSAIVADPLKGLRRLSVADFRQHWSGFLILLTPSPGVQRAAQPSSNQIRWWSFLFTRLRIFPAILSAAVPITLLNPPSSFFIQPLVDFAFQGCKPATTGLILKMHGAVFSRVPFQGLCSRLLRLPLSFLRRKTGIPG